MQEGGQWLVKLSKHEEEEVDSKESSQTNIFTVNFPALCSIISMIKFHLCRKVCFSYVASHVGEADPCIGHDIKSAHIRNNGIGLKPARVVP